MGKKDISARAGFSSSCVKKGSMTSKHTVPDVASLGALMAGGSSQDRVQGDENIQIFIRKYCTNGSIYNNAFSSEALYVMLFVSEA